MKYSDEKYSGAPHRTRVHTMGSLTVALLLAAAYVQIPYHTYRWWPEIPVHWAQKPILLPVMALLILQSSLPEISFHRRHRLHVLFVTGCVALAVFAFGVLGLDKTYSSWRLAAPIVVLFSASAALALRLPAVKSTGHASVWWYFGLCAVAFYFWPAWLSETPVSPLGNMVMNFLFIGMAEELAFRGVIYGYLAKRLHGCFLGLTHANWVTALLFAWIHNFYLTPELLPWLSFALPMGLLFGVLREKTGSWIVPGIGHGLMIPLLQLFAVLGLFSIPGQ